MDYKRYNRTAWNNKVREDDMWTLPVTTEEVNRARLGDFEIVLTPTKKIPRDWFPKEMMGVKILCLASGGGQQAPILAATGADVTVIDYSPKQLEQDKLVAKRDNLRIETIEADMMDIHIVEDESFDVIVHPWSNCFVSDVNQVWEECYRVLRKGGVLMAGFGNPLEYIFDLKEMNSGKLVVRHSIPYSDLRDLEKAEFDQLILASDEPIAFGHSLEDQIGGQLRAGFVLTDLYEDNAGGGSVLDKFIDTGIATRAVKL